MSAPEAQNTNPTPRISVLIDATDQSGIYLPQCLFALMTRTNLHRLNVEYQIILDEADDANIETVNFFTKYTETIEFLLKFAPGMSFVRKPVGSTELPFNILAKAARGHWIFPIKASTIVKETDWDERLIELVEKSELNPAAINFIAVPLQGANMGSPLYIVSQGYYLALDHIAPHVHAEDYIATLVSKAGFRTDTTRTILYDLDVAVEDREWGSWERSFPENIDEQFAKDVETLTRMIKAGY